MENLHDSEAERLVLSKMMRDTDRIPDVLDSVEASDFYDRNNQLIFDSVKQLFRDSQAVTTKTVADRLEETDELDELPDGGATVAELYDLAPSAAGLTSQVDKVNKMAQLRRMDALGADVQAKAEEGTDPEKILSHVQQEIQETYRESDEENTHIGDIFADTFEEIEDNFHADETPGFETGFYDLDELMGGFRTGQLAILAGRPSIGKTSLARNITAKVCHRQDVPAVFFSLEQTKAELSTLFACQAAGIPPAGALQGDLTAEQLGKLEEQKERMDELPLHLQEVPSRDIDKLYSKLKRLIIQADVKFVVVDYLQLLDASTSYNSRQREIAEISHTLKQVAVQEDVIVLALSQLNRKVEDRNPPEPQLADLRSSGAIEQDANIVQLLYRPEYYGLDGNPELTIAKNRNGQTGVVQLDWNGRLMKFSDVSPESLV